MRPLNLLFFDFRLLPDLLRGVGVRVAAGRAGPVSDDQFVDLGLLFDGLLVLQHLLGSLFLGPPVVGLWSEVDDLDVDGLERKVEKS